MSARMLGTVSECWYCKELASDCNKHADASQASPAPASLWPIEGGYVVDRGIVCEHKAARRSGAQLNARQMCKGQACIGGHDGQLFRSDETVPLVGPPAHGMRDRQLLNFVGVGMCCVVLLLVCRTTGYHAMASYSLVLYVTNCCSAHSAVELGD